MVGMTVLADVPKEELELLLKNDTQRTKEVMDGHISFIDETRERLSKRRGAVPSTDYQTRVNLSNRIIALIRMKSNLLKMKKTLDSKEFLSLDNDRKISFIMEANIGANRIYESAHVFDWRNRIVKASPRVDKDYDNPKIMRNFAAYINAALSESRGMLKALKEEKNGYARKGDLKRAEKMDRFIRDRMTVIHSLSEAKGCLGDRHRAVMSAGYKVSLAADSDNRANVRYYKSKIPFNWEIIADVTMLGVGLIPVGVTQIASLTYFTCKGIETVGMDYAMHRRLTRGSISGFAMALCPLGGIPPTTVAGRMLRSIGVAKSAYLITSGVTGSLNIIVDASDVGWSTADIQGVLSSGIFIGFAFIGPRISRKLAERHQRLRLMERKGASVKRFQPKKLLKWTKRLIKEEKGTLVLGKVVPKKRLPKKVKPVPRRKPIKAALRKKAALKEQKRVRAELTKFLEDLRKDRNFIIDQGPGIHERFETVNRLLKNPRILRSEVSEFVRFIGKGTVGKGSAFRFLETLTHTTRLGRPIEGYITLMGKVVRGDIVFSKELSDAAARGDVGIGELFARPTETASYSGRVRQTMYTTGIKQALTSRERTPEYYGSDKLRMFTGRKRVITGRTARTELDLDWNIRYTSLGEAMVWLKGNRPRLYKRVISTQNKLITLAKKEAPTGGVTAGYRVSYPTNLKGIVRHRAKLPVETSRSLEQGMTSSFRAASHYAAGVGKGFEIIGKEIRKPVPNKAAIKQGVKLIEGTLKQQQGIRFDAPPLHGGARGEEVPTWDVRGYKGTRNVFQRIRVEEARAVGYKRMYDPKAKRFMTRKVEVPVEEAHTLETISRHKVEPRAVYVNSNTYTIRDSKNSLLLSFHFFSRTPKEVARGDAGVAIEANLNNKVSWLNGGQMKALADALGKRTLGSLLYSGELGKILRTR